MSWHHGRWWTGHKIEDECPCAQEACGLVDFDKRDPDCPQHQMTKTIRQGHRASECPATREDKTHD